MKQLMYLGLLISSFFACKSSAKISQPSEFEGAMITFGNGGGFSGRTTTFVLLENGQVFREGPKVSGFVAQNSMDSKVAQQMFNNYYDLGLSEMDVNDPGNMYYFIKHNNDGVEKKLTWGGYESEDKITVLKTYYRTLISLVSKSQTVAPPPARK